MGDNSHEGNLLADQLSCQHQKLLMIIIFPNRKWDLKTLKCVKIYNGHQETVVAIDYCKKSGQFASASLDKACKGKR